MAGARGVASGPDDGRGLLAAANLAEDTIEGLRLARRAVAVLEPLVPSAERDALLTPAKAFVAAVSLFTNRHKGEGLARELRQRMASQLESIPADHPLHTRATFHLGRYYYWLGRQNGLTEHYAKAREYFAALDEFKDERLVRMYRGEKLAWPSTYDSGTDGAPAWAIKQREALSRVVEVIHYWINDRQDESGSLGGGWGDDVEILRFWPVAMLAADDELTRIGMRRLVEGVWHSPAIDRKLGYASRLTDVEHSAEPTADSQPMMLFHDFGSPRYVERNLRAMKLMPELWTDVNPKGHRLFKASWFSATELDTSRGRDVCSPYCVRAVKAGHWLGWYGGYPEITRLFTEWMDPWVAAAESTARGKPKGVLPASLRFSDEQFGGSGPTWYDSGLGKLYRFPAALGLMFEQLLTTYALSNNIRYLRPIETAADLVIEWDAQDPKPDAPPGSRAWAAEQMRSAIVPALSKWRALTGKTKYDAFLRRAGSPYLRYLLTQDMTPLLEACEASIDSTKFNREMVTTEVRWTDRVAVQGTETLLAMYTGHIGHQGYWPLHAVTWEGTGPGFAALVRKADERSLNVLAFGFGRQRREVSLRLWRLRQAGRYRVSVYAGDTTEGERLEQWTVDWKRRGDAAVITLPARRLVTIVVEPIQLESGAPWEGLPDVAIGPDDVKVVRGAGGIRTLEVTVHNLSTVPAGDVKVRLTYLFSGAQSRVVQEVAVPNLVPAPHPLPGVRDFTPVTARVTLPLRSPMSLGEYELSAETSTPDRNPRNNRIRLLANSNLSLRILP